MTVCRRATPADAAELARLRAGMFDAMGSPADPAWTARCADTLARALADDASLAAYVVDDGTGRLLSFAFGRYSPRLLPSARTTAPHLGEVVSVATDPAHRRQGHARVCLTALLAWLDAQGVSDVRLKATTEGQPLYEQLGFQVMPDVVMARVASSKGRDSADCG